ncbi:MAG: hypothetical protein NXH91_16915 [Phyllobacteriaceae bacterium]|nr:hypothetical protein [Phyllobacteriaceae bacterium]
MRPRFIANCVVALGIAGSAAPVSSALASENVAEIADGQPWQVTMFNGRRGEMTFNPDGTLTMRRGIMSMGGSWSSDGEQVCLTMASMRRRCVTFEKTADGYLAVNGENMAFAIRRP